MVSHVALYEIFLLQIGLSSIASKQRVYAYKNMRHPHLAAAIVVKVNWQSERKMYVVSAVSLENASFELLLPFIRELGWPERIARTLS